MFITVTESMFIDAFRQSELRKHSFSYEGLKVLFAALQDEECEFDIVAIDSDWCEYKDGEELLTDQYVDFSNDEDLEQAAVTWLNDNATDYAILPSGGYIVQW